MKAKRFNTFEEFDMKPGSYVFSENEKLCITLPCGDNFVPDGKWDVKNEEDEARITITPSIFCSPQKPCWHGYLTNGEFINA